MAATTLFLQVKPFRQPKPTCSALEGFEITLAANASEEGKLYGSIGPREVADAVSKQGITLEKSEVIMGEGPIRYTGEHEVLVHLHADVETQIKVTINPE
jgi:large subunit ribosomal protein L9